MGPEQKLILYKLNVEDIKKIMKLINFDSWSRACTYHLFFIFADPYQNADGTEQISLSTGCVKTIGRPIQTKSL